MLEVELPYSPRVNHYWRRVGPRTLISRGGRAFRQAVCSILAADKFKPLVGSLEVHFTVFPPDGNRRDIDKGDLVEGGKTIVRIQRVSK